MTYRIKKIYKNVGRFWDRRTPDNPYFDEEQWEREVMESLEGYRDDRFDDIADLIDLDDYFGLDMSEVVDEYFDMGAIV